MTSSIFDFLDDQASKSTKINEPEKGISVISKKGRKPKIKSLAAFANKYYKSSLNTYKEMINHLPMIEQEELIKIREQKRKETKINNKAKITDINSAHAILRNIIEKEIFPVLFRGRNKQRTISIKSPYDKKTFKFTYTLKQLRI